MLETLTAYATAKVMAYVGGSLAAFVVAWILKKIPNEKIKIAVGKVMYSAGVAVTLGLSKWKVTAGFWNRTIEPFIVDLIDNVVAHGMKEFIRGLRSDS